MRYITGVWGTVAVPQLPRFAPVQNFSAVYVSAKEKEAKY